ncbi:hypothetical protein O5559_28530, partial [Escherichia coli]|nr:hypothetical protein [Escherichia coli]
SQGLSGRQEPRQPSAKPICTVQAVFTLEPDFIRHHRQSHDPPPIPALTGRSPGYDVIAVSP